MMIKKRFRTIALFAMVLSIFALVACAKEEPEPETDTFFEVEDIIDGAPATATPEPTAMPEALTETEAGDETGDETGGETTDESAPDESAPDDSATTEDIDADNSDDDSDDAIFHDPQLIVGEWVIPYVMDKGKQSTLKEFAKTWDFGESETGEVWDYSDMTYELYSNFVMTVNEDGTGAAATVVDGAPVTLPLVYTFDGKTLHLTHEDGEEVNVLTFSRAVFNYNEETGLLINKYWLSPDENTYLILEKR
ncbi:MAG: hypothetical protein LBI54_09575 [Lachnospiraceae bacterium]|jgi:hypothetical protein|nr:hypothetical protein [Lachnospiraceae bacterium]